MAGFRVICLVYCSVSDVHIERVNWVNVKGLTLDKAIIEPDRNDVLYNKFIEA